VNFKSALLTTLLFLLPESLTAIKMMFVIYHLQQRALSVGLAFSYAFLQRVRCSFFAFEMGLGSTADSLHLVYSFCLVRSTQFREKKLNS